MPHVINSGVSSYTFEYPFTLQPMRTYLFTTYFFTHHYSPPPSVSMLICLVFWSSWLTKPVLFYGMTGMDAWWCVQMWIFTITLLNHTQWESFMIIPLIIQLQCLLLTLQWVVFLWCVEYSTCFDSRMTCTYMQNASDIPSHRVIWNKNRRRVWLNVESFTRILLCLLTIWIMSLRKDRAVVLVSDLSDHVIRSSHHSFSVQFTVQTKPQQ